MTVHPPALAGAYTKLDRAVFHLDALNRICAPLVDAHSYEIRTYVHGEGLQYSFRVNTMPPIPSEISGTIGDIVHNLAAALDHAAWGLVIAHGGSPDTNTQYPIFRTPRKKRVWLTGLDKTKTYKFLEAIDWFQPHRGNGAIGDGLAIIEDLDIIDKHRELLVTSSVVDLPWYPVPDGSVHPIDARYWEVPLVPPAEILRLTFDTQPDYQPQPEFSIQVRLSKGADYLGSPWVCELSVLALLKTLIRDVDGLLYFIGTTL